jgi:hypothetical protein
MISTAIYSISFYSIYHIESMALKVNIGNLIYSIRSKVII